MVSPRPRGFAMGTGEKADPATRPLPPGSFVRIPAEMPHYAKAVGETIVQINGVGPFDVRLEQLLAACRGGG